jgi:hypothetical protein
LRQQFSGFQQQAGLEAQRFLEPGGGHLFGDPFLQAGQEQRNRNALGLRFPEQPLQRPLLLGIEAASGQRGFQALGRKPGGGQQAAKEQGDQQQTRRRGCPPRRRLHPDQS